MDKNHKKFLPTLLTSIFFGLSFGLFCYAFWLSTLFPPLSRRVIGLTIILILAGSQAGYRLIKKIIAPAMAKMRRDNLVRGASLILMLSFTILWFGFEGIMPESGYIAFLLPTQHLEITVPNYQQEESPEVQVSWFNTLLGEVSFNSVNLRGWERVGDILILRDADDNEFTWSGRTGEEAVLVFRSTPNAGKVNISWNGKQEVVDLASPQPGDYIYRATFSVPIYASPLLSLFFGFAFLSVVLWGIFCFLWMSKPHVEEQFAQIENSISRQPWNRIDYLCIAALLLLAFILRSVNLEAIYPLADEYSHLNTAKKILEGASLSDVYSRSLYIVTLPVAFFIKVFGPHLWAARLAGVVFNTLAIIPLYIINRKFNRSLAVFSSLMYSISPWIIAVSRNVREYGYYPFYFYWAFLILFNFWENFPHKFAFSKDWKSLFKPKQIFTYLFIAFTLIYAKYIDPASTFRTIFSVFLVFALFILLKVDWKNRSNLIFAFIAGAVLIFSYRMFFNRIIISPNFLVNLSLIKELFSQNSPVSWFYNRTTSIIGLAVFAAFVLAVKLRKDTQLPLMFITAFFLSAISFSIVFNHYIRPRYFFNLHIWFVLLISFGLYGVWIGLRLLFQLILTKNKFNPSNAKWLPAALSAGMIFASFNFKQVLLPISYTDNGFMPITTEYHYNLAPVHALILDQFEPGDVLIHTVYGSYARWMGEPNFSHTFYYNYKDPKGKEKIWSIIEEYPSGWIVLDHWHGEAYSKPLPFEDFSVNDKQVIYLGEFIDEHVWRW